MHVRRFLRGFKCAAAGIIYSLKTQRNMRIHFIAALLVLGLGYWLRIDSRDMLFVFFAIALVITAEMVNTAVEAVVDLNVQDYHPGARAAKDIAAGAVLVAALNSIVVAYIVFYPYLKILFAGVLQ